MVYKEFYLLRRKT